MPNTLQDAIAAINAGDKARGKQILAQLLHQDPANESAWLWMSGTVDDPEQRRFCLQKVLAINPANTAAQAGLNSLNALPAQLSAQPHLALQDHGLGQSELQEEQPETPHSTPAFIWPPAPEASDDAPIVEETFIGDIVAAMNQEEATGAGAGAANSDLDWLIEANAAEAAPAPQAPDGSGLPAPAEVEAQQPEALPLGETEPPHAGLPSAAQADQPVTLPADGDLEEVAPKAFPSPVTAYESTPGQMWENPASRANRLIILTDRYLIAANPKLSHMAEINTALLEGQVPRRALGRRATSIPLDRINTVRAIPHMPWFEVVYQRNKGVRKHKFTLASAGLRDEALEAIKTNLGADYEGKLLKYSRLDAISVPGLLLVLAALITGLLIYGAWHLQANPRLLSGQVSPEVEQWLLSTLGTLHPFYILLVGGGVVLLILLWLLINLRKPARTLILKRRGS